MFTPEVCAFAVDWWNKVSNKIRATFFPPVVNREILLRAGFRYCDMFFKWYNFCGLVALK
jgi:hypothetical protein